LNKKAACVLLAVLMVVAVFSGCGDNQKSQEDVSPSPKQTAEATDEKEATKKPEETEKTDEPYPGEITSILLMGSMNGDFSDANNQNYALTHILITIDPETRSLRFTTFPYNLMIKPVLEDVTEPIQLQFLYMRYGADVASNTLSKRFGVEIDGWVVMNMEGVKTIVDETGGLEIDIQELSVNDMAETVESILGYIWIEIKEKGKQMLSGIQISGFFMDTYNDLDEENPAKDEELRFREKHPIIIDALISALKTLNLDENQMVEIAAAAEGNFLTNIKTKDWKELAKMALACTENEHEYLHIPKVIEVEEDGWSMIYDEAKDVNAVMDFVKGE